MADAPSPDVIAATPAGPSRRLAWLGDLSAWLTSFATHVAVLLFLGTATLLTPIDRVPLLLSSPVAEDEETPPATFRVSEALDLDVGALSEGGEGDAAASAPLDAIVQEVSLDLKAITDVGELPTVELPTHLIASPDPENLQLVRGVGAVGTTGSRGAVDRLTGEILLALEQRPTLVVWLFDRSASLGDQRKVIVDRFDQVYRELGVIAEQGAPQFDQHDDQPLLTAVGAFCSEVKFLGKEPTVDVEELKSSIRGITEDAGGDENVFGAILAAVDRYKRYRLKKPRRNVLLIVVTDEAGDDLHQLDRTVELCRKLRMPVYVLGAPAPFGRQDAYVRYVDPNPQYDQTPQWLPVRQGPESHYPERLKLGSIGRGDFDGPTLDSGFGPFGLTRLTNETGGFYIAIHPLRVDSGRARSRARGMTSQIDYFFDHRLMRRYRPDYVPTREYERRLSKNAARTALVQAASLSWTEPLGDVRRDFPKLDDAQFAEDLTRAQRAAARIEPRLAQIVATLRRGETDREKLSTPRWQAGFDLAMGRALAAKVRAEGYNAMLARAKQGMSFSNEKRDTWILRGDPTILTGSRAEAEATDAQRYLKRVMDEHQGTPWALLAERELRQPLGWEWQDEFRNLAERIAQQNNNPRPPRPERPEPKRRPPPKL